MSLKFKLNTPEELEAYRQTIERIVLEELDPIADQMEPSGVFPHPNPIEEKLNEMEVNRLTMPRDVGGYGLKFSQYVPILESGAKGHGMIRGRFHAASAMWRNIYHYGSEEQKKKWMPRYLEGMRGPAFALTEPGSGSGQDVQTTAVKQGNNYTINGHKHLISGGPDTPAFNVVVRTGDKSLGPKGISYILVENPTPGFTITPMPRAIAPWHDLCHLEFKNCVVPVKNRIGEEGLGYEIAMRGFLDPSRVSIATSCLGICQRLLELSLDFAKRRVTFGKPIAQRQAIQYMLAEMATDIEATRLLVHRAAQKFDEGTMRPKDASMAKVFAVETSNRVSDKALLIHGGIGVTRTYTVERLYRDARLLWFEEGAPSIQKFQIAREILGFWP